MENRINKNGIDTDVLIATVNSLADRAEHLLSMRGENANPSVVGQLFELGREIEEFSFDLAHAGSALGILSRIAEMLRTRAQAYAEVYDTPQPEDDDFAVTTNVGLSRFGERYYTATVCFEEMPF